MRRSVVPLLLLLGALVVSVPAQETSVNSSSVAEMVAALKGKSFTQLKREFARYRAPVYDPSFRSLIIAANIRRGDLRTLDDRAATEKVRARIRPVLELYERQTIEIVLYQSAAPNAICIGGTALFFSTGLFETLTNDYELQAITAHELAHEYVNALSVAASEKGDHVALQRAELTCDAFAVAALKELEISPTRFMGGLRRLMNNPATPRWKGDGTDTHPSLESRLRLIEDLTR